MADAWDGRLRRQHAALLDELKSRGANREFELYDFLRIEQYGGVDEFMGAAHPCIRNSTLVLERLLAGSDSGRSPGFPGTKRSMLFNDLVFLFAFLPGVLILYSRTARKRTRFQLLLVASYVFYGSWDWRFVGLLLLSTTVDFLAGRAIGETTDARIRKAALIASIATNLGILGFFKYYGFFVGSLSALLVGLGLHGDLTTLHIVLPVGISFYTFQSMSYTIDVFRGGVPHTRDFFKFAAFVSLFPQLVAGPLLRYSGVGPQLDVPPPADRSRLLGAGLQVFLFGLFKKVLVADTIALFINPLFDQYA